MNNVMGVNNRSKITKKSSNRNKVNYRRKKRVNFLDKIPTIINYLTSDFHFYSPLVTSSSSSYSSTLNDAHLSVMEKNEAMLRHGDGGKLKAKLVNYLKSDDYLYAPLGDVRLRDSVSVKNIVSSSREQDVPFTRVTSTVLSKKIAWQTKQVAQDSLADLSKRGRTDIRGVKSPPIIPVIVDGKRQAPRRTVRDLSKSSK